MTNEQLEQIKNWLTKNSGWNDGNNYRTAMFTAEINRKLAYLASLEAVNKSFELSLLLLKSDSSLIDKVSPLLLEDASFIFEAFKIDKHTYRYASEKIKQICGYSYADNPMLHFFVLESFDSTRSSDTETISKNLEILAAAQKEREHLDAQLSTLPAAPANATARSKIKI